MGIVPKKRNLVLLQAFPANRANSVGPIKFFEQFFNVYFIEIPGFEAGSEPLKSYEIKEIKKAVEKQLNALEIDDYVIGGLSFGCLIINHIKKLPNGCKAIIYLEPYFGAEFLKVNNRLNKFMIMLLFSIVNKFKLYNQLWNAVLFKKGISATFGKGMGSFVDNLLTQVHPRAFFELASRLLVQKSIKSVRSDLPTILVMNPKSDTLKAEKTVNFFKKSFSQSRNPFELIYTGISHNAEDYAYYKKAIKRNEIESMLTFIGRHYSGYGGWPRFKQNLLKV